MCNLVLENKAITINFLKKNPYNLPYLGSITGGSQGGYLRTDPYA
jgi:hypothetical protein